MDYTERISSIPNLCMEAIIENCRCNIPERHRQYPYYHPELNHGLDLLKSEEVLDCYMGAYGEMHHTKCKAALQNLPFPPKDIANGSLSLEIIDWGCGQGIGTISLIDFLKERHLTKWIKKVVLIEPSQASLKRAVANVSKATDNGVRIIPVNDYLPSTSDSRDIDIHFEQDYVFHIFSNILDVTEIDLAKLAKSMAIPGHTHYVICTGPLNANSFRIDRFCDIFKPTTYFSNIASNNYGRTSDTNYCYTCKTKSFIYDGGTLDLCGYNPDEKAREPVYGEYDVNLKISNGMFSYEKAWVYYRLQQILAPNDLLYSDPDINGSSPDFIIIRPNVGIIIITLFEENLSKCALNPESKLIEVYDRNNSEKPRILQSPLNTLENFQNLIIEDIPEFTEAIITNNKNLNLIKKVLICTKGSLEQATHLLGDPQYTAIYDAKFIKDVTISLRFFNELKFNYRNAVFDNVVLNRLKQELTPQWHSYREGISVKLTRQQESLARSVEGAQRKISGVAGSGKTQVLATRAVNAQVRSGGDVLLLTFNITLANYMRMRLSEIRADFPWDKIHIDYYHRFFRKHAYANNLHVHFCSYDDVDFFEDVKSTLTKYDAILIDEVQDYLVNWLQLLRKYFLKENGEFIVFGDPKQNIYHRELDSDGNIRLGIIPGLWNKELTKSQRFTNPALANLAMAFQRKFNGESEDIECSDTTQLHESSFQFNLMKYQKIEITDQTTNMSQHLYHICKDFIDENNISVEEVAILATQTELLRQIDYLYRNETGKETTVTFIRKECVDRISSGNRIASYSYKRNYDRLEKAEKNHFTMQTRHLKLSTIQSFKGWEAPTVICIIKYEPNTVSPELIYTGLTRAKENLFIINIGDNIYDEFFNSNLQ